MKMLGVLTLVVLSQLWATAVFGRPIKVTVTDEVLVPEVRRFGINLGNDAWFEGSILTKERIPHGGFEGVLYRQLTFGPGGDANTALDWFQLDKWKELLLDSQSRFVCGPRAWKQGRVMRIVTQPLAERPDVGLLPLYTFSNSGPAPEANDGLLFEKVQDDTGYVGQHGGAWWVLTSGQSEVRTVSGDVPPGSRGRVALELSAQGGSAGVLAPALSTRWVRPAGRWRLSFWARGQASVVAYLGDLSHGGSQAPYKQSVETSGEWRQYELEFVVGDYAYDLLGAGFELEQGAVLLDEVSLVRLGDSNPTAFRDDVVNALKRLRPGVLRHLQIGGSSLDNILEPRLSRLAFSASRTSQPGSNVWPGHPEEGGKARVHSYGLHEFLELCAEVGADPWYCVPGTFTPEEMRNLMEYLAGPDSTTYGAIRARRGRREPWVAAFKSLFIEIGNEAWNEIPPFLHGGYSRKGGYWDKLFAEAKESPHFSGRIRLVAGGQAVNPERNRALLRETPHCDLFAVAPYLLHELSSREAEKLGSSGLLRKALELPSQLAGEGWMVSNHQWLTQELGKELAVYEVNHHVTGGDAPAGIRNDLVAGIAGGINVAHWMLLLLERFQIRVQNFFTFLQYEYPFAADANVKLWGGAISIEPDNQRYRPTWLALQAVNSVLSGDLVRVRMKRPMAFIGENGEVAAFATREGNDSGVLLFNLDLELSSLVRVRLLGAAGRRVRQTRLSASAATANNEPGKNPQVILQQSAFNPRGDLLEMELPPCSLTVLDTRGVLP